MDTKASGDLKFLGYSLTCTSASTPQEYFRLLGEGSAVSTQGHTFNHQERTLTVYSHSFPLCAENHPLKGQNGSLERLKHRNNQTYINILPCNTSTFDISSRFDISYFCPQIDKHTQLKKKKLGMHSSCLRCIHTLSRFVFFYLDVKLSSETLAACVRSPGKPTHN